MVRSQEEANQPAHTAWRSWSVGGDAQETDGDNKTWSDWAALATDGTMESNTISSVGPMV